MKGRVRSLPSQARPPSCWSRIAEVPLQWLKSAVALVLYVHAGVSELLAHDGWKDLLSPQERHYLRPENGAE